MSPRPIPPPLEGAQQRAWEAAYVLTEDFPSRIPKPERWRVNAVRRAGPCAQGWESVCFIHVLFGQIVEERQ